jgi:hypothetical protein
MSLWGNKDSKTASGTISITSATGAVVGSSTLFTTQAKIGNTIRVGTEDYQIVAIASDTAATVRSGVPGATMTAQSGATYTLSEKPASARISSANDSGLSNVFGVDTTEIEAGGDNVTAVSVAVAGTRYLEVPGVTVAAPPSFTIATTAVNTTADTITVTAHKLLTGTKFTYTAGGTVLGGLSNATAYFAIVVDANTLKVASSLANAQAGTAIDLTGTGNNAQTFTGDTATATATISGGAVTAVTVTDTGTAYLTAPTVTVNKPRRIIPTSGVTIATDTVAYTAHGLVANEEVKYNNGGGASATGLVSTTSYFVANAGLVANAFEVKAAAGTGTLVATVATSGTAGQFTCGASTLAVGDRVKITGTNTGTGTITGYATGTTYKVSAVTGTSPSVTGFTLTTEAAVAIVTTAGTLVGLTYTTETVIDISGTGNNAQYFEIQAAADQATAVADLGSGAGGIKATHAGWVKRTVGTGGRAGRVQTEVLVAMGSITGDQADDIQYPDA